MTPLLIALALVASAAPATPAGVDPAPTEALRQGLALELGDAKDPWAARWAAADRYHKACRRGSGAGCYHFERLMGAQRPGPKALQRQRGLLGPACALGRGEACFRLGLLYDDDGGVGLDVVAALEHYHQACDRGYAYACQRAAELHLVLMDPDYAIAVTETRALAKRSCDAGYGRACVVLADLVKAGKGGPRDLPASRGYLQMACVRGQADACVRLAKRTLWLAKQRKAKAADAAKDVEPLVAELTPSCERGHPAACETVVGLLMRPLPTPQPERARQILATACRGAHLATSCEGLAKGLAGAPPADAAAWKALAQRHGPAAERKAAARLRSLCDDGTPWACQRLATQARARGEAAEADRLTERAAAAQKAWRAASVAHFMERCGFGKATACARAAHELEQGGDPSDKGAIKELRERAKALGAAEIKARAAQWRAACDADEPFGCLQLAKALRQGRLGAPDEAQAAALQARHDALVAALKADWAKRSRGD